MTDILAWVRDREGRVRTAGAIWALVLSGVCSLALLYHAQRVAQYESQLQQIVNYAAEAVIVCNSNGQVIYANDAVRSITGFTEEDLIRGGVEQVIPEMLRGAHRAAVTHAKVKSDRGIEGINYRRVYPVRRKDGSFIPCVVSVGSVRQGNKPQFFAFIVPTNVTTSTPATKGVPTKADYEDKITSDVR